jgi:hypothetical protein
MLREMLKAGALSPDVTQAALDVLASKRRKAMSLAKVSPDCALESFALTSERYMDAARKLGKHVPRSEHSSEERNLICELTGGQGTVFRRHGRVGARFDSAGFLTL